MSVDESDDEGTELCQHCSAECFPDDIEHGPNGESWCIDCYEGLTMYFDDSPPPQCDHQTYETDTCPACVFKVMEDELQRVIQERDEALRSIQVVNFWLNEFSVRGNATPEAIVAASKEQGDVLRRRLGEARAEAERLRGENQAMRQRHADEGLELAQELSELRHENADLLARLDAASFAVPQGLSDVAKAQKEACIKALVDLDVCGHKESCTCDSTVDWCVDAIRTLPLVVTEKKP